MRSAILFAFVLLFGLCLSPQRAFAHEDLGRHSAYLASADLLGRCQGGEHDPVNLVFRAPLRQVLEVLGQNGWSDTRLGLNECFRDHDGLSVQDRQLVTGGSLSSVFTERWHIRLKQARDLAPYGPYTLAAVHLDGFNPLCKFFSIGDRGPKGHVALDFNGTREAVVDLFESAGWRVVERRTLDENPPVSIPQCGGSLPGPGSDGVAVVLEPPLGFDFAVEAVEVDGNVNNSGSPDGRLDFRDTFNDGSLTRFPTSEFVCSKGLFPVSESDNVLHLSSSDGANNFSPGFLVDNCALGAAAGSAYALRDGQGGATILAIFRADIPSARQSYGLQVFTLTANDVVNIVVGGVCGSLTCVTVQRNFPTFLARSAGIDLTHATFVCLRLELDDATNRITALYSVNCGAFTMLPLPEPATTFTSGSARAVASIVGSVFVG